MKLDINKLGELLKAYGLSLKIENDKAVFTDIETNQPMKSFVIYKRGYRDQHKEYTDDVKVLLNGWYFYLILNETCFKLNISLNGDNATLFEIAKTERIGPHEYDCSELKTHSDRTYTIEETRYRTHTDEKGVELLSGDTLSEFRFGAGEMTDTTGGMIVVHTDDKSSEMYFEKDELTGDFDILEGRFEYISKEETIEYIRQSRVFKDTIRVLCPKLWEKYSKAITNSDKLAMRVAEAEPPRKITQEEYNEIKRSEAMAPPAAEINPTMKVAEPTRKLMQEEYIQTKVNGAVMPQAEKVNQQLEKMVKHEEEMMKNGIDIHAGTAESIGAHYSTLSSQDTIVGEGPIIEPKYDERKKL